MMEIIELVMLKLKDDIEKKGKLISRRSVFSMLDTIEINVVDAFVYSSKIPSRF